MRALLVLLLVTLAAPAFAQVGVLWDVVPTGGGTTVVRSGTDGTTFVAGNAMSTPSGDRPYVAHVAADGTTLWATTLATFAGETIADLVVAPDGALYLFGSTYVDAVTRSDVVLHRVEADGTLAWEHLYDGPTSGDQFKEYDTAVALAVDGLGYVTATAISGFTGDMWTTRHAPNGVLLWSQTYVYAVSGFYGSTPVRAAVDCAGNAYIAGHVYGGPKGKPGFVVSYAPDGTTRFVHLIAPPDGSDVAASVVNLHDLDVACDGTTTVSGTEYYVLYSTQSSTTRAFVDRSGGPGASWQVFPFPNPSGTGLSSSGGWSGLSVGGPDAIYLTAEVNAGQFGSVRTARLRADGSMAWVDSYSSTSFTNVVSIRTQHAADASGVVMLATTSGPYVFHYRKLGPDGTLLWQVDQAYDSGAHGSPATVAALVMSPDGGATWGEAYGHLIHAGPAPAPAPTYAVDSPAAGTLLAAGAKVVVRWSGPGVPDGGDTVDLFLRQNYGPLLPLATAVRNIGRAKVTIPADTPTGSGYALVVARTADPTVVGTSGALGVTAADGQYVLTEPDADETWQRGSTHTVLWTAPPGAPSGGTVAVTLLRRNNSVVSVFAGEPDDGSMAITTAANLAAGEFYLTVESEANAAFGGQSPLFGIGRIELTAPAEGATWAAGSSQAISWTTNGVNIAGNVRQLSLRRVDGSYSKPVAINVPYANGTKTFTVPAAAPAGEYYAQLLYEITSGAGVLTQIVVKSSPFIVTSPVTLPPVVSRHFGSPEASADARETLLVVRGLAQGAEVGVYAGETLLATGVVESGDALIAVPSETVVDGEDWYFGETAALTLRVFDGSSESSVDARTVTLGSDGSVLDGVRLASGDVVVVDAAKGGAVGDGASSADFAVAAWPNPTSGSTAVAVSVASSDPLTVTVVDVLGRTVATLLDGAMVSGRTVLSWDARGAAPGVYVVRATSGEARASARVTVVR